MAIPKHNEMRVPVMELLKERGVMQTKEFVKPLAELFTLSEDEITQNYSSGNGPIFYDRISWALSYLNMANLLDKPQRGRYLLNAKGVELLKTPDKINTFVDGVVRKISSSKKGDNSLVSNNERIEDDKSNSITPKEEFSLSFTKIKRSISRDIIDTILNKSPYAFEKLVVMLLQKMGYGGEIQNSGSVTQRSNDGGIDGIIKEDVLGFGRIYIQAKRYKTDISIGREAIQKFVGALAVANSNKGVFITTSYYTKGAIEYVNSLNGAVTLVLINGEELAEHIYNYGLGMQVEQTIEIKRLDADFWDVMSDDNGL